KRHMQAVLLLVKMHRQHFVPCHQSNRKKQGRFRNAAPLSAENRNRPLGSDGGSDLLLIDRSHIYKNLAQPQIRVLFLPLQGGLQRLPTNIPSRNQLKPNRDAVLSLARNSFWLLQQFGKVL